MWWKSGFAAFAQLRAPSAQQQMGSGHFWLGFDFLHFLHASHHVRGQGCKLLSVVWFIGQSLYCWTSVNVGIGGTAFSWTCFEVVNFRKDLDWSILIPISKAWCIGLKWYCCTPSFWCTDDSKYRTDAPWQAKPRDWRWPDEYLICLPLQPLTSIDRLHNLQLISPPLLFFCKDALSGVTCSHIWHASSAFRILTAT